MATTTRPRAKGIGRRGLFKSAALLGGSTLLAGPLAACAPGVAPAGPSAEAAAYLGGEAVTQLYSVCLNCNTGCGIKARIENGVLAKIDGNPFSPWTMTPHVPYATSVFETAKVNGALCPKGQAGVLTAYDPYRITRVLKRAGRRGENKWVSVPFDQALTEIVEGGKLFSSVPGEENRQVAGLRELWALRDPKVASSLAADASAVATKKMKLEDFKTKHAANLKYLIDPDHPDLGPINNQVVFNWGRMKGGRSDFVNRFFRDGFGTTNTHGHTTVCQGSLYFTGKAMSEQFVEGRWTGGKKFYWQVDHGNAEFVIFVGASPFEANYGPPLHAGKMTANLAAGKTRIAVVDPRLSKVGSKAWKWLPALPGSEGALGLGLVRWVIENKKYDERFLRNANKAAASADKEPSFANGSWLVKIEKGAPGAFLRASDLGLPTEKRPTADGKGEWVFDAFVVQNDGKLVTFDPNDTKTAVEGDLFVDGEFGGIKAKSALQLIRESAFERTLDQVADLTGLKAADIVALGKEFTSHGKKAVADVHRGVSQHTNGFYNVFAWYTLNALIGNYDWKGGLSQLAVWDTSGTKPGQPHNVGKHPSKTTPFGISIIRHDVKWEDTTLFEGKYPAKRNWYPLASDIYQEVIPSIGDAYPYPVKVLIQYMGSPVYALPAGHTLVEILTDTAKLPLFVSSDITIGETSMYADYIFPDLSYLERWEFHGSHPSVVWKVQPVRQPVIAPLVETAKVYGEEIPISLESMLLGLAEKLGLPGFGPDGFDKGVPLTRPEDLYIRMVANVAAGEKADAAEAVPDATAEEMQLFLDSRKHLPKSVFDAERWKKTAGDKMWAKTVYVLNRGGRFVDHEAGYDGALLKNKYGTLINLYQEKTAKVKNAFTGKPLPGYAVYIPAGLDALGRPIEDPGYDMKLITFKDVAMTKSRTAANYWLLGLAPENHFVLNKRDADSLGLKDGDKAHVSSASNPEGIWDLKNGKTIPMVGTVKVIQGIRPGVVAFSLGHGHWSYGGADVTIDGKVVKGDPRRVTGVHANAAMRTDPVVPNTTLGDLVGASAVFYDSKVKLVKA